MAAQSRTLARSIAIVVGIFAIGFAFDLWRVLGHSMWRDEAQAWLIVRASPDLGSLFAKLHFEAHPPLWYLCLYAIKAIWPAAIAMPVFVAVLAAGTWTLLLTLPCLTRAQRVLLCLNYGFFFEYAVISRSYVLSAVLHLVAAVWIVVRWGVRARWAAFAMVGLLGLTAAHAIIIAGVVGAALLYQWRRAAVLPFIMLCGALALSAWMGRPDPAMVAPWAQPHVSELTPLRMLGAMTWVAAAIAPVPPLQLHFWNRYLWGGWYVTLRDAVTLGIVTASLFLLRRSRVHQLLFVLAFIALSTVEFMSAPGMVRHGGFAMLGLFALVLVEPTTRAQLPTDRVFTAWIAIGALAGVLAGILQMGLPFSRARDAAHWIRDHAGGQSYEVIATVDATGSALIPYLDHDMFYASTGHTGSYIEWSATRDDDKPDDELYDIIDRHQYDADRVFVLVGERGAKDWKKRLDVLGVVAEKTFGGPSQSSDTYAVFQLGAPPPTPARARSP